MAPTVGAASAPMQRLFGEGDGQGSQQETLAPPLAPSTGDGAPENEDDQGFMPWSQRVDLVGAYSNLPDHRERLRSLLELPRAARSRAPRRTARRAQKRLDGEEVARLVATHEAGAGVKELAGQFGIHRQTVSAILKREGALRAPGIRPDDLPDLVRLYEEGWSLRRLGARLGVAAGTVGNALRKAGVVIRRPGPRPARP